LSQPGDQFLYRRIPDWYVKNGKLKPAGFRKRSIEETLSVYSVNHTTPRKILQLCIDEQAAAEQSEDDVISHGAKSFFYKNGRTVDELIAKGWRVAIINASAFTKIGWIVNSPDEIGHIDIEVIEDENLDEHLKDIADEAILLSAEECLKEN
jgi:hypothetical protein